jgi:hypothetical protein
VNRENWKQSVAERQPEISPAQRAGLAVQNKFVLKGRWKMRRLIPSFFQDANFSAPNPATS